MAILIALIASITAVLVAWFPTRSLRKTISSAKNDLADAVAGVAVDAKAANHGVNNQDSGMPTLVQRVIDQDIQAQALAQELRESRDWSESSLEAIAKQVGVVLPTREPVVQTPSIQTGGRKK